MSVTYKIVPSNSKVDPQAVNSGVMLFSRKEQHICDLEFKPVPIDIPKGVIMHMDCTVTKTADDLAKMQSDLADLLPRALYHTVVTAKKMQIYLWALLELISREEESGVKLEIILNFQG